MQTPKFGDCVGVDSSADLKSDVEFCRRRHRRRGVEFPPPISWLGRSEDLPWHVPWVMKKCRTSDGRLVINLERVERREYFLADRSDGRLVLRLVYVDDDDDVVEECGDSVNDRQLRDGGDERSGGSTVEEVASECCKYNGMGVKPCGGFVAPVAAPVFRPPVHT